jgi:hypothetical protein
MLESHEPRVRGARVCVSASRRGFDAAVTVCLLCALYASRGAGRETDAADLGEDEAGRARDAGRRAARWERCR